MRVSRREFLKLAAVTAGMAPLCSAENLHKASKALRAEGAPRVIWLQGSGCDGCAISFLNSIHDASVETLLTETLDMEFQSNLMAASGGLAVSAAQAAGAEPGYILVVEGAIPTGAQGRYCMLWPGMTMEAAVTQFAANASFIVALGACASYGGVTAGAPNPTQAQGVQATLGTAGNLINLPGCPGHPDWLVGTLVYLMAHAHLPPLDEHHRPLAFFSRRIHDTCFNRQESCHLGISFASELGQSGCLEFLGCKGKKAYGDCAIRKWNSRGPGVSGVNWCVGSGSPCLGCTEPGFPDEMSPFFVYSPTPEPKESRERE